MGSYRLIRRAERDLFDLFVYGLERFGATQSAAYQEDLERCFAHLREPLDGAALHDRWDRETPSRARKPCHLCRPRPEDVLITAIIRVRSVQRLTLRWDGGDPRHRLAARSRSSTRAAKIIAIEATSTIVAIALISGVTPRRIEAKT